MRIRKRRERFNIMLVGASGLGKTAVISTVLENKVESEGEFTEHTAVIQEKEIHIIDTRGYGVKKDMEERFAWIDKYVKERYKEYLHEETKVERNREFEDRRIHLVVHFLSVSRKGMKEYDLSLLKLLHTKTNVICVIPRCDGHTEAEIEYLRAEIKQRIAENNIDLFGTEEIAEEKRPICVFGAQEEEINEKKYIGRSLLTGQILVGYKKHSDLIDHNRSKK